jgi:hypothetical protein
MVPGGCFSALQHWVRQHPPGGLWSLTAPSRSRGGCVIPHRAQGSVDAQLIPAAQPFHSTLAV